MICTIVGKTKGKTRNSLMTQKIDITILRFTRNYMDDEKQKAGGEGDWPHTFKSVLDNRLTSTRNIINVNKVSILRDS